MYAHFLVFLYNLHLIIYVLREEYISCYVICLFILFVLFFLIYLLYLFFIYLFIFFLHSFSFDL